MIEIRLQQINPRIGKNRYYISRNRQEFQGSYRELSLKGSVADGFPDWYPIINQRILSIA